MSDGCSDCVAYRHVLKDILRGDPKDYAIVAMKALNDTSVSELGKLMHKVVKAAVQVTKRPAEYAQLWAELDEAVTALQSHAGPTVRGWLKE